MRLVSDSKACSSHLFSKDTVTMTPDQRKWLLLQIEVLMRRQPNVSLQEMKTWIRADPSYNWDQVKKQCFNNFLKRSMDKFRETGSMKRRPGGGPNGISINKARKMRTTQSPLVQDDQPIVNDSIIVVGQFQNRSTLQNTKSVSNLRIV